MIQSTSSIKIEYKDIESEAKAISRLIEKSNTKQTSFIVFDVIQDFKAICGHLTYGLTNYDSLMLEWDKKHKSIER